MLGVRNPEPVDGDQSVEGAPLCRADCPADVAKATLSGLKTYSACATAGGVPIICPTPTTFGITTILSASICAFPEDPGNTSCDTANPSFTTSDFSASTSSSLALPTSSTETLAIPGEASLYLPITTSASTSSQGYYTDIPSSSSAFSTGSGAASNSTKSQAPITPVGKKSGDITGGAAAGIAIGCLIAGAAIAALVFFFLFKRYKDRQQREASSSYLHHLGPHNGAVAPAVAEKGLPVATTQAVSLIDTLLPQPAEDDAIIGELSRLRDKIKNHAETFYHTAAVDPVMVDESELLDVARATGIRSMTLCDMLLNPQTRIVTIRLFISYVILSRCGGQGGAGASLLPPEVGMFADALAGIDGTNAGQLALKSKWQSISATLLASRYGSSTFSDSDARGHSIAAVITVIDGVLRPFVSPHQDDAQRLRNLQGVVQRAAAFAFLLFSQPSTFRFQWSAHGKLAVFPALLQTSDESAQVLNPPHVFVDLEVA